MGVGCEVVYGTDGVEFCMVVRCEVVYGIDDVESCMVVRCEVMFGQVVLNGSDVWTRWCRIVYGGEVRGRIWDTCMEQIVPMYYMCPQKMCTPSVVLIRDDQGKGRYFCLICCEMSRNFRDQSISK